MNKMSYFSITAMMLLISLLFITGTLGQKGRSYNNSASSCLDVYKDNSNNPSDYYWIRNSRNNNPQMVYCAIRPSQCGGEGVWMRVGFLLSTWNNKCPGGLLTRFVNRKRICSTSDSGGCLSVHYDSLGKRYTEVCGMVRGYQYFTTDAFGLT